MGEIWISGPVTGCKDLNRPAFEAARDKLEPVTDEAIMIPHDVVPKSATHEDAMRRCLEHIIAQSTLIIMLTGWASSNGARLEYAVAKAIGIPVLELVV